MTLNHVHLGSKNVKSSFEFYKTVFGFRKKFDHGEGIFIENSAGFLIAIDPANEIPELPEWFHLGFCLKSEDEVLAMYTKCRDLKVKIARDMLQEQGEYASFFVSDPDGYKLEISWHKE